MKIIFIGMRACGKTMLGQFLAQELNAEFIDLDQVFEAEQGMRIKDFIAQYSFTKFRDEEEKILKNIFKQSTTPFPKGRTEDGFSSEKKNHPQSLLWKRREDIQIMATGGGIIERENNRKRLKEHSPVIFIDRDFNDILATLRQDDSRPSITGQSLSEESTEIYQRRLPYYQNIADYTFSYSDSEESWESVTKRFSKFIQKLLITHC